jgi:uncharacterized SAM-binding protein YcdF (DUF218 family)
MRSDGTKARKLSEGAEENLAFNRQTAANYLRLYSQREQLKCISVVHLTYAYTLQRAQLTLRAVWLEADLVFFPAPLPSPFAPPFPLAPPLACPPSESAPIFAPF